MSDVKTTVGGLKALLTHARKVGTVENWIGLALQWMDGAEAEIERLRECEEIKLCQFLNRPDIMVGLGEGKDIVVHHHYWHFEGRSHNVLTAARMAMLMERKAASAAGARE